MIDKFLAQMLAPFFALGCLAIGYPITYYVRHKMKDGWLKRLLLTEFDPKKAAAERERLTNKRTVEGRQR